MTADFGRSRWVGKGTIGSITLVDFNANAIMYILSFADSGTHVQHIKTMTSNSVTRNHCSCSVRLSLMARRNS